MSNDDTTEPSDDPEDLVTASSELNGPQTTMMGSRNSSRSPAGSKPSASQPTPEPRR